VLRLTAPAKVNLTLEVLARREDGYHSLRSLMVPIGLSDVISIGPSDERSFTCADGRVGADNSVVRALESTGVHRGPVALDKRIPIGGGLGGGSSDAAAVLLAAMTGAFGGADAEASARDWLSLARGLGSDVPFFLVGTGALVEGAGERVTAVGALPAWWAVVACPPAAVPTAEAYRMLDAHRRAAPQPSRPRTTSASVLAVEALQRHDFAGVIAVLHNDFEAVVLREYPAVSAAHSGLSAAAGTRALLSGSGACSFALFETQEAARAAAARFDSALGTALVAPFVADERWR
jgi:4-diphosphocytidyl-2-C-methyl-D-erythritol kinase